MALTREWTSRRVERDPTKAYITDPIVESPSAQDGLKQLLRDFGLPEELVNSLAGWAWAEHVAGKTDIEISLDLLQRPEIKAEFPELEARSKQGQPVSIQEILAYRQTAAYLVHQAGLPAQFADKTYLSNLIINDVSVNELQDRISLASDAVYNAPPEVRAELDRYYASGFTTADVVALALDPTVAEPAVRNRITAARLGAAGVGTGYGEIGRTAAERLASQGVTAEQGQQGFGTLAANRELFGALPGESAATITPDEQLAAVFSDNEPARRRIEGTRAKRKAMFGGGGSIAAGREGVSGLGSAAG